MIRTHLEAGPRIWLAQWAILAPFYFTQNTSGLAMVSSTSNHMMNSFLKRNIGAHPRPGIFLVSSTSCAKPTSRKRQSQVQSAQAGLTLAINNGQVEGQVTRIKLIKRMMYGKAGFALLRQRVLHRI